MNEIIFKIRRLSAYLSFEQRSCNFKLRKGEHNINCVFLYVCHFHSLNLRWVFNISIPKYLSRKTFHSLRILFSETKSKICFDLTFDKCYQTTRLSTWYFHQSGRKTQIPATSSFSVVVTDLCSVIQKNQNNTKVRKKLNISLFNFHWLSRPNSQTHFWSSGWLKPQKMHRNQRIGAWIFGWLNL